MSVVTSIDSLYHALWCNYCKKWLCTRVIYADTIFLYMHYRSLPILWNIWQIIFPYKAISKNSKTVKVTAWRVLTLFVKRKRVKGRNSRNFWLQQILNDNTLHLEPKPYLKVKENSRQKNWHIYSNTFFCFFILFILSKPFLSKTSCSCQNSGIHGVHMPTYKDIYCWCKSIVILVYRSMI